MGKKFMFKVVLGIWSILIFLGIYLAETWYIGSLVNHGIMIASVSITLILVYGLVKWNIIERERVVEIEEESISNTSIEPSLCFLNIKSKEPLGINVETFEQPLLRLTLCDILEATNNFCKTNIIGDGGFRTVYKDILLDGKTVAIKKLNRAKTQGHREFLAEMETLGKINHRNLVPLLGYCSFGEENLLVYECMVNGSLNMWLRNRARALEALDWPKRLKIAMEAACGLAFLHHGFIPHIIHRDIKESNILLDDDFEQRLLRMLQIVAICLSNNLAHRPTMLHVVKFMKGVGEEQNVMNKKLYEDVNSLCKSYVK